MLFSLKMVSSVKWIYKRLSSPRGKTTVLELWPAFCHRTEVHGSRVLCRYFRSASCFFSTRNKLEAENEIKSCFALYSPNQLFCWNNYLPQSKWVFVPTRKFICCHSVFKYVPQNKILQRCTLKDNTFVIAYKIVFLLEKKVLITTLIAWITLERIFSHKLYILNQPIPVLNNVVQ